MPDLRPGSSCSPRPCRTVRDSSPRGTAVLSTRFANPEQVGVGGGRRRGKDRRGGQPGRPRRGPGWGRPGLRRGATVSPSLRPPAAVAAAQPADSGVASAASRVLAAAPLRTPAGTVAPASRRAWGPRPGRQPERTRGCPAPSKMAAPSPAPCFSLSEILCGPFDCPLTALLIPSTDHLFPTASPWRTVNVV